MCWKLTGVCFTGYQYIAAALKGSEFPRDVFAKKNVLTAHKNILERINPKELVPELNRRKVINDSDTQHIITSEKNDGPKEAVGILLDRVWRRHENWYAEFLDVLSENYSHICKQMDPGIFASKYPKCCCLFYYMYLNVAETFFLFNWTFKLQVEKKYFYILLGWGINF